MPPAAFERRHEERAASPGAFNAAAVLGALKVKPLRAREMRGLDRPCARRRVNCAGRDGRMGSAGAEQKDGAQEIKEDEMTSDAVA